MRGHEDTPPPDHSAGPTAWRQAIESLVLLAVAVILFRTFAAEGFLISTGSMAPSLLGYHRRVVCPNCHFLFARGAALDEVRAGGVDLDGSHQPAAQIKSAAVCPNCGYEEIDWTGVPRNEGDQLLVHKHAYEFRDPRRWEVVVFRNVADSNQAYVKRVVGLPGETVEIVGGNVVADGRLQRKPLAVQRAMRVLVSHDDYRPVQGDASWRTRWRPSEPNSGWTLQPRGFRFAGTGAMRPGTDWIEFRHWVRSGGGRRTSVPLRQWPRDVRPPDETTDLLDFDTERGALSCRGALPVVELNRWLSQSSDPEYQRALRSLYAASHEAPVTDRYGYNAAEVPAEHHVREWMVELTLDVLRGDGRFEIEMTDGRHECTAIVDFARLKLSLLLERDPVPVAEADLMPETFADPAVVTVSMFDQQVLIAVNGEQMLPSRALHERPVSQPTRPGIRLGANGLDCGVEHLCVYRDVYYTAKPPHGTQRTALRDDEFFVLGDNSPVSVDSRAWRNPAVHRSALIGKPLVVHLPSKQYRFELWGQVRQARIPDFSRVRYIH